MWSVGSVCVGGIRADTGGRMEQGGKERIKWAKLPPSIKGCGAQNIKETNQKFTQASITTQSRIEINKIIKTQHNETRPPIQATGTRSVISTKSQTLLVIYGCLCAVLPHTINPYLEGGHKSFGAAVLTQFKVNTWKICLCFFKYTMVSRQSLGHFRLRCTFP